MAICFSDSLPEDFDKFDRNNHQTHVEEGAYVVPASDEHSLYNQFSKIKIQTLNKHNIRYCLQIHDV